MFLRFLTSALCMALITASVSPTYAVSARTSLLQSESAAEIYRISKNPSLGGIKIGMSEQQVRSILGKPLKIERITQQCDDSKVVFYTYATIQVDLDNVNETSEFKVAGIRTTNPQYQTDRGIRVGDSIAKAKATYPGPDVRGGYTRSSYSMTIDKQGKITEIILAIARGC
jgi:hypothetical protein